MSIINIHIVLHYTYIEYIHILTLYIRIWNVGIKAIACHITHTPRHPVLRIKSFQIRLVLINLCPLLLATLKYQILYTAIEFFYAACGKVSMKSKS